MILPTLNEATMLAEVLVRVREGHPGEVIVVDGGSTDRTVEIAEARGARVLTTAPGRAKQMNAGATAAAGDVLLFLHADTLPPTGFVTRVLEALGRPGVVAGAFALSIDGPGLSLRIIERLVAWRSRLRRMPYGDQGLFLAAETFAAVGGYPEVPALEDYELLRRLRKRGRIALADGAVVTSARRWRAGGVWRTTLTNQLCILARLCGVSHARIAAWRRQNA